MRDFHYIAVEGVLGVGKTSFAKMLSDDLQAKIVLEQVDNNPFLEKFYRDMGTYALQTQLTFLLNRAMQQEPLRQMDLFTNRLVKPDLVVYLQASIDVLLDRIKKRGRSFEKSVNKDYLYNLSQAYNHFFSNYTGGPLAIVNTDDVDFVNDPRAFKMIKDYILSIKGGINYYTPRMEK